MLTESVHGSLTRATRRLERAAFSLSNTCEFFFVINYSFDLGKTWRADKIGFFSVFAMLSFHGDV